MSEEVKVSSTIIEGIAGGTAATEAFKRRLNKANQSGILDLSGYVDANNFQLKLTSIPEEVFKVRVRL